MAERTNKKTPIRVKKAPATLAQTKPVESANTTSLIGSKVTNLRSRYQALSTFQRLGLFLILLALVGGYYFKGLFVAAMVNGQPIPRLTVIKQLEKENGKKALDDLVTKTLILQESKRQNITISDAEVSEEAKKIEDRINNSGSNFEEVLTSQGLTRETLLENIRFSKLIQKLVEKDIQITESDIANFLEQNKASLPKDASPEALNKQATDSLKQQKQSQKASELIEKLKKDAKINYFINY